MRIFGAFAIVHHGSPTGTAKDLADRDIEWHGGHPVDPERLIMSLISLYVNRDKSVPSSSLTSVPQ